jgi:antitoxin component YwqK of YwqJK toxin-antitoxin module
MKRLKWIVPIAIAIGIWTFFQVNQTSDVDGFDLIPADALYIIETDKPIENWKAFRRTDIWNILKTHPSFLDLTDDANYLDTLLSDNPTLFKLFRNHSLLISAHNTTRTDYDFLFVVEMGNKVKPSVLFPALQRVLKASGYKTTKKQLEDVPTLSATGSSYDDIHFAQIGNQLVCSYSLKILTNSIATSTGNSIIDRSDFKQVFDKVSKNGLCRLHLPYSQVDELMQCYFSDGISDIKNIGAMLGCSSVDFETHKDYWTLDGYTNLDSSNNSLLNAIHLSGKSENMVGDVLSNRTAWCLSFNYTSFNDFEGNLKNFLVEESKYANYLKRKKQIETLLDVSVDRDLLSWIGQEISVAQLRKNLSYNKSENALILIKTDNITQARARLSHISDQVKKRTPALFKQIDYKSYQIQYLEIKGFFKLIFGEKFNKITKPYYITLDDYVVFSNSPYTLIGLIEDYENQRILSNTSYYKNYKSQSKTSSLSLFVSPMNLYPTLTPMLDAQSAKAMRSSEPYFASFESFGLNLQASGSTFKTHVFLLKKQEPEEVEVVNEDEFTKLYKRYASKKDITSSSFVLELIEDGLYKKQYPGSNKIQIKAETNNGVLDGSYTEYFLNGEIRLKGKYKMGRKKGTWKYYDASGDLTQKKKY